MSVTDFYLDEKDLTANQQGTMVMDQNGEKCALIKIETTQKGYSFDIGSLGVQKVDDAHTGEVWVYIPAGARKMSIHHQQLGSLRDYSFPITISKAKTYVMKLTTGEIQTVVKSAVTSQYVLFELEPKNAIVELDGQTLETADGTATKRMPFGEYSYRVQAPRYEQSYGNVVVNDSKNKHVVHIALTPAFQNITLRAKAGTEIWIDNVKKGVGTYTGELSFGTYLIETRREGHRSVEKEIVITRDQKEKIFNLPEPTPIYGSLDINSVPANAEIIIDGQKVGTTPMFIEEYLVGSHKIEIKKEGYIEHNKNYSITEGKTCEISATLEEKKKGVSGFVKQDVLEIKVNGCSFSMIPVQGGTFSMGATPEQGSEALSDEVPVHNVTLSSYYIGKYEVTQELWQSIMGRNPSDFEGNNKPVENVTWEDCQTFISKLNSLTGKQFRLPTEAEWEFAARGGNKKLGCKYSGSNFIPEAAWYLDNSNSMTHDVGNKRPNELGIFDMSGNVWEWCSDKYDNYTRNSGTNPKGSNSGSGHVCRGGSWDDIPKHCRLSYRSSNPSNYCNNDLGLRLVLSE